MKLQELIQTNHSICKMEVCIRDNGHKIQEYHIGPYEQEDRYADPEHNIEPRWITIKEPINFKDIGKEYWGVFLKNIPKQLLELEVTHWVLWSGWTTNNGLNKHMWLVADVEGVDKAITIKTKPVKEIATTESQLDGQTNLFDYIEE